MVRPLRPLVGVPGAVAVSTLLFCWCSMPEQSAVAPSATDARLPTAGYFVVVDGRRLGPLSLAELTSTAFNVDSWTLAPGSRDWQRAEQIDVLRQAILTPPPLPTAVPAEIPAPDPNISVAAFKPAVRFLGGIVLCYLLTAPVLWLASLVGLGGGIVGGFVAELPIRACEAGACFYFARATRLPLPGAWALPGILSPPIGLLEAIGLAIFGRRRFKAAGITLGFFGPRN